MDDLLRSLVRERAESKSLEEHPDVATILAEALDCVVPRRTDDQAVGWYGRRWVNSGSWHPRIKRRLESLCQQLDSSGRWEELTISRQDVFDRRDDAVDLFLVTMAWGFGTTGYGCWRTAAMICPDGEDRSARIAAAVDAYREAWSFDGAVAVARAWANGEGKVPGLGPAFASKLAYFAIYDRLAGAGALIADLNTAWSAWALCGIWDSRYDPVQYSKYVQWCTNRAQAAGRRSDDIERVLFGLGPEIRRQYSEWKAEQRGG